MRTLFKVAVGAVLAVIGYKAYQKYVAQPSAKPIFTDTIPAVPGGIPAGKPL